MTNAKKGLAGIELLLVLFFTAIMYYILFGVVQVDLFANRAAAAVFQIFGSLALCFAVLVGSGIFRLRSGYDVPTILAAVIYTVVVELFNLFTAPAVSGPVFIMLQLLALFVCCLVLLPLVHMGLKSDGREARPTTPEL